MVPDLRGERGGSAGLVPGEGVESSDTEERDHEQHHDEELCEKEPGRRHWLSRPKEPSLEGVWRLSMELPRFLPLYTEVS